MTFLLDTAAVSEWTKPRPNSGLVDWMDNVDEDRTYLSVITVGELRRGVERLADGKRKNTLTTWLDDEVPSRFEGRILAIGGDVADAWGRLTARLERGGRTIGMADALIAATAECRDLQVVTRNVSDFEPTGVGVVNPWTEDH